MAPIGDAFAQGALSIIRLKAFCLADYEINPVGEEKIQHSLRTL